LGGLLCQMGLGYNYVFGALAPDVIATFDWTKAQFAAARVPQLWVMALASPAIGWAAVRFGPRAVLVGATSLLGGSFLALGRLEELWQLYALLAIEALAVTGLGDITVGQLISRWFDRHRGLALGLVYTGSNLGGALVVRAVGLISGPEGWREVFGVLGGLSLCVLLPVAYFVVREPPSAVFRQSAPGRIRDDAPESEGRIGEGGVGETEPDGLTLKEALATRSFWILAVALAVFFFYFVALLDHLVLFLTEQGWSAGSARSHLSNAILLGMFSKIAFGFIADRVTPLTATLLDFALLSVSSLLLLAPPSGLTIGAFVVVFGFSTAARDVVYPIIISHCFGVRSMAQIYGGLMLALPAGAFGVWFAAALSDRFGGYGGAFLTFAVLNLVTLLGLFFLRDERREREFAPAGP
jgi:sugar phosphate permease